MNGPWIIVLILFLALPIMQIVRQNKSMKRIHEFRSQLKPGMAVETAGGLHGVVVAVHGDVLDLNIAPGIVVEWSVKGIIGPVLKHEVSSEDPNDSADIVAQDEGGDASSTLNTSSRDH
ncbi:preprotein translocase subunit YajC [Corynebacterium kroppenstedtii]|uniref:preprotein translocase subunit YajC n=1 Tax=Corynebacterium sp. PCR 32 TaxID=3351342 RepID=UPI0030AAE800